VYAVEPLIARKCGPLMGQAHVPGDKSISHRALIFGAMAVGKTTIEGLLEADDVMATAGALRAMGVQITKQGTTFVVDGVGVGGLMQPAHKIDLGNSGTGTRLLMGLIASHDIEVSITGDASLSKRPMGRVLDPLREMGARVVDDKDKLPLILAGSANPLPITYRLPVPSAQVKSAILLAGLNTPGVTTVIEPELTRDHTERMLQSFGANIVISSGHDSARRITLNGRPELQPQFIEVPGDPSSAAFLIVAALIIPESEVIIHNVMMSPTRSGLIDTLLEMGAEIEFIGQHQAGGELVSDLKVRASELRGVDVPASRAPSMIDEYPILAVAAAFAKGTTWMRGLSELRVKESDRLEAMSEILCGAGVDAEAYADELRVTGVPSGVLGGNCACTRLDHRLAMSGLVLGLASDTPVSVDDAAPIRTSFIEFTDLMISLGADISPLSATL